MYGDEMDLFLYAAGTWMVDLFAARRWMLRARMRRGLVFANHSSRLFANSACATIALSRYTWTRASARAVLSIGGGGH